MQALFQRLRSHGARFVPVAGLMLLLAVFIITGNRKPNRGTAEIIAVTPVPSVQDQTATPVPEKLMAVQIAGYVANPGVYFLTKGSLMDDLIRVAGGMLQEADDSGVNRVFRLSDNMKITIRARKEAGVEELPASPQKSETGAGTAVVVEAASGTEGVQAKIDINSAGVKELDTLPGIGESTAKDIVQYREKHGPYKKTEDLMKVPGIKESKFNKIRDLIETGT